MIYLFGFSRGAYTIRCVRGVLAACGIPKNMKNGSPLHIDPGIIPAIATEAVKNLPIRGFGQR
jgi:hypothetical protein